MKPKLTNPGKFMFMFSGKIFKIRIYIIAFFNGAEKVVHKELTVPETVSLFAEQFLGLEWG